MSKDVLILGGGPSGLMAAWAAVVAGWEPFIYEKPAVQESLAVGSIRPNAGVFYLHSSCDLPLRSAAMQIIPVGAEPADMVLAYKKKVYHYVDNEMDVSIPIWKTHRTVFDAQQAMLFILDTVKHNIRPLEIRGWDEVILFAEECSAVVSTIPLDVLLPEQTWDYSAITVYHNSAPPDECYTIYNVNPAVPWYRAAAVFGNFTMEYRSGVKVSSDHVRVGGHLTTAKKVLPIDRSKIPPYPNNLLLAGRYGVWDKNERMDTVYSRVLNWLWNLENC